MASEGSENVGKEFFPDLHKLTYLGFLQFLKQTMVAMLVRSAPMTELCVTAAVASSQMQKGRALPKGSCK